MYKMFESDSMLGMKNKDWEYNIILFIPLPVFSWSSCSSSSSSSSSSTEFLIKQLYYYLSLQLNRYHWDGDYLKWLCF